MVFTLVHEVGNRTRWRTDGTMSLASAKLLADELERVSGVTGLRVNPRTGSVVVTVADWDARGRVAAYFASLEKSPLITRVDTTAARRALARAAKCRTETPEKSAGVWSGTIATVNRALSDMPVLHVWQRLSQHFLSRVPGRSPGRSGASARSGDLTPVSAGREEGTLDFAPLTRFLFFRPLLPVGLNAANALLASVPFVLSGVKSLLRGRFDVAVLDGAALLVSLLRRDFRTAGLLIVLLGLGEMLESYTRKKSMASLADELALRVDSVWVRRGDGNVKIALRDVTKEDVVVVHAGNAIPVDGIVVDGDGSVNQASMTGEPLPVHRMKGGTVFAGTVLEDGELMIRPTGVGDGTRLQQIVRFIENSEAAKAGIEGKALKWADRIVPYHFLLAGLVWLVTRDFARMASVLMVDFSCALRLATPLAILTAMRTGTQRGVVVKGGKYLEALAEVDTVVFDKTGTLTASAPKLSDVVSLDERYDADDLLRLAACLEEHFPHPVGRAVVHAAEAKGLAHAVEAHDAKIDYVVAHGIASSVEGARVLLGSRHFVEEDEGVSVAVGHEAAERLAREGKSILYLAVGGKLAGLLGIEDPVRAEAKAVIAALHERGVKEVWMLTGDDERTARVVAETLGIDHYRAGILPADKAAVVMALKEKGAKVLMVGDGVNDSPALSASDVGVTLRDGADIAQEVADVVLSENTLAGLPVAMDLGKAAMARIRQNFVASVGLNGLFLAGGLTGTLMPAAGALLHNGTTIGVCLNAMRDPDAGGLDGKGFLAGVADNLRHALSHVTDSLERAEGAKAGTDGVHESDARGAHGGLGRLPALS